MFSLNEDTGILYLSKQIGSRLSDIRSHSMNVTVYDPSQPSTLRDEAIAQVHVLDSNDHAPEFSQLRYIFTISKKSTSDYVGKCRVVKLSTEELIFNCNYNLFILIHYRKN